MKGGGGAVKLGSLNNTFAEKYQKIWTKAENKCFKASKDIQAVKI